LKKLGRVFIPFKCSGAISTVKFFTPITAVNKEREKEEGERIYLECSFSVQLKIYKKIFPSLKS
jgi:hypothetical protein